MKLYYSSTQIRSLLYPRSSGFVDKVDKAMVCGCVYTSGMDWHREGWTGEAIV